MPNEDSSSFSRFFSRHPWIISASFMAMLVAWVANGDQSTDEQAVKTETQVPLAKVTYDTFVAQPVIRSISLYGKTTPDRQISLRSEIASTVTEVKVSKGALVSKGDVIMAFDKTDRPSQLKRAKSLLTVRQKEYNAAKSLKKRGLQGEVAFSQAEANLIDARAALENLELGLARTEIRAPFDGVVDQINIELGDYVKSGDVVAHLVDLDPLVVKANVSERHIEKVKLGTKAPIKLLNGNEAVATLRYRASIASDQTNTFDVELELPNPTFSIPAGISTEIDLPLEESLAVKVTPSMLALDNKGNLGVKTLSGDQVKFMPINLVKTEKDGVWLSGLGDSVNLITKGQGFVRDGDQVIAVSATK
ncbi:efflux transporter periplasmic adaptor subunit [Veronia nyctiphanis]|uniref:Efflux transporter periplasmic adaptor subunit n=2 Tax=Veronia nyctiphanis TaxID=1278244 RepID=A0A4Q0YRK0_9GAMM|nr:efflux transporter periplasmic adaptor subunit [Veronia nyctiphanis]